MSLVRCVSISDIEISDIENINVYNIELESSSDVDDLFWVDGVSQLITHNCLPKDLKSLISQAKTSGYDPMLLSEVDASNIRIGELRKQQRLHTSVSNDHDDKSIDQQLLEKANELDPARLLTAREIELAFHEEPKSEPAVASDDVETYGEKGVMWQKMAYEPIDESIRQKIVEQFKVETVDRSSE